MHQLRTLLDNMSIENDKPIKVPIMIDEKEIVFYVKRFTLEKRDEWELSLQSKDKKDKDVNRKNFRAKLFCYSLCDETGAMLYNAPTECATLPFHKLETLFDEVLKIQGLGKEDSENREKNS